MWISISVCSLIIFFGFIVFANAKRLSGKNIPKRYPVITWRANGILIAIIGACAMILLLLFVHRIDMKISSAAISWSILGAGAIAAVIFGISTLKEHKKEIKEVKAASETLSSAFSTHPKGLGSIELYVKHRHPDFKKLLIYDNHMNTAYVDVPKKYTFTSVTIGGITTGGVTESGGYIGGETYASHTYELRLKEVATVDKKEAVYTKLISHIDLSSELMKKAKNSKISQYLDNTGIVVIEDVQLTVGVFGASAVQTATDFEIATNAGYPSMKKCYDIIEWLSEES